MNTSRESIVVDDSLNAPAGLKPLSASTSHSYPRVSRPGPKIKDWLPVRAAASVFRQSLMFAYSAGTLMSVDPAFTRKNCPVSEFSGLPPPPAVPNLGSRHVPVHDTGSVGALK